MLVLFCGLIGQDALSDASVVAGPTVGEVKNKRSDESK
jgi:hypothetical protein